MAALWKQKRDEVNECASLLKAQVEFYTAKQLLDLVERLACDLANHMKPKERKAWLAGLRKDVTK